MKRYFAIILSALVISAMAGCSNSDSSSRTKSVFDGSSSQSSESVQSSVDVSQTSQGITALYPNPDSCKLKISEKRLLSIRSDNGTELASDLLWVCDDESIATVDSSGNVIGKSPGDCVITVSRKDQPSVTAKIPVTVKPNEESSAVQESSNQTSETSTSVTTTQPSASNEGGTTIIYVTPSSGTETYSVPSQYTYYYGKNNFSYSNPADGYIIHSMVGNYLYQSDVSRITKHDAQMLINAIYAKHGYIFKDAEVNQFFNTQDWYKSISIKTESMETISKRISNIDMDNHNLNLLLPIARS